MGDGEEYLTDYEVVEDADVVADNRAIVTPDLIVPPSPVHPLSSLVTIVLDLLWKGEGSRGNAFGRRNGRCASADTNQRGHLLRGGDVHPALC